MKSASAAHSADGRAPSVEACAAALARLPGIGPATLVSILRQHDPAEAWDLVGRGELTRPRKGRGAPGVVAGAQAALSVFEAHDDESRAGTSGRSWASIASRMDVAGAWERAEQAGVRVAWFGGDGYPEALVDDPNPPGVLFWMGSLGCLSRPTVAIVGTRNATSDGRATAFELGRDLAEAGVCVVSGLALGIDGAAHHGALDAVAKAAPQSGTAAPLGVAASGVDVPYPRQHSGLWDRVCAAGAVLSETPPGQPAQAWRFPTRNRIIAALSRVVVVVESHLTGGSLITAEAALERGIEVRAVPGPVRSPASRGSNQLLYDGPGPVRGAQDVLDALGLFLPGGEGPGSENRSSRPRRHAARSGRRSSSAPATGRGVEHLSSTETAVLEAVGWRAASLGQVVDRSGVPLGEAARVLDAMEGRGLLSRHGGWWTRTS